MAEDEPEKGETQDREAARGTSIAYAAGLSIFFSVLSCMGLGWVLDRQFGTRWMMVAGIVLGAAIGFYQFIRIMSRLNK
jgi:F0F1-type ATP synthase assembly protein I